MSNRVQGACLPVFPLSVDRIALLGSRIWLKSHSCLHPHSTQLLSRWALGSFPPPRSAGWGGKVRPEGGTPWREIECGSRAEARQWELMNFELIVFQQTSFFFRKTLKGGGRSQVVHHMEGDSTYPEKLKLMPRSPSHRSSCLQFFSNGSCHKTVCSFLIHVQISL